MPPDSQADGPCGPKARRTRGPASPGQRTAQPFGGTLNASPPALYAGGASVSRRAFGRHSAGRRTRGASASRGVPQVSRRPPYTRGIGPRRRSATHAGRRTRGPRPPRGHSAGLPQAAATRGASASRGRSAGLPPHAGPRPSRAFRGPRRPAAHAGHRPPRGFRRSPAARPPHTGPQPSQAFRRPPAVRRHTGHRPPAGIPQASRRPPPHAGPSASRGRSAAHAALAGVPQAARRPRPPSPPRSALFPQAALRHRLPHGILYVIPAQRRMRRMIDFLRSLPPRRRTATLLGGGC